jgi:hypothetical protein
VVSQKGKRRRSSQFVPDVDLLLFCGRFKNGISDDSIAVSAFTIKGKPFRDNSASWTEKKRFKKNSFKAFQAGKLHKLLFPLL